ncbi:helix-turn-helix domain-containing protein [Chromobacterium sphagni]|uniref:HTH luxR-type domain-containing protein n=1 Tax=Chromobacterium sphagni TaxID=1903179 RepID=A0ABX3CEB4_9NEIS|nr:helix-turn-helix transcriptional regulator [Chromobacterium sphagni]OHX20431.1 hypothetical protein BI344_08145 [Chromobacterium sphagni]
MPFPVSALVHQFLEQADAKDMLSLLSMLEKIARQDVPLHMRAGMAVDLRALLADAALRDSVQARQLGQLSDSEVSVVLLIAAGKSHRRAAEMLDISERTIRAHVENSMKKLGLKPAAGDKRLDARLLIAHIFLPDVMQRIGD